MFDLVIYHANCADGFCSAWLASNSDDVTKNTQYIPANYGDIPPEVNGKRVLIVDFSYPRHEMINLLDQTQGNLVVLDHHRTSQASLDGLSIEWEQTYLIEEKEIPEIIFDMNKSGAMLAWDYLYGDKTPRIVEYVQDRDLWKWELPYSREVSAVLASHPFDFDIWNRLSLELEQSFHLFIREGTAILRYQQGIIDNIGSKAKSIRLGGFEVYTVNATGLISEIGEDLAEDMPFSSSYFIRYDLTKKIHLAQFSLRSRADGVDVSEIAKQFGGGGHKHAAGFSVGLDKLSELLING